MRDVTPETITDAFAAYAADAADPRAREVFCSLARHLHAFVKETRLTHAEWLAGLAALVRAGEITTPERNEFILFSDLLGVSALVDMVNTPPGATSCSNLGPFHQRGAPALPDGGDLWKGQPGEVMVVTGRVLDAATGEGVAGAALDLWQNADNGLYAVQDAGQPAKNYHGTLHAAPDGRFAFSTTRPQPYSVPEDGPAGDMLRALGRKAGRPAHLHVIAEAAGYRPLVTELFPEDDPCLDSDAVFGVREDLVVPLGHVAKADTPRHLVARDSLPERVLHAQLVIRMARA
ncbi:dioxygenase [Roseomonas sp. HF4]|uniref:dioxygenase family protein n=1 Tax=Roseomonas sp. HF4 TaxID=2562313 RepID=UPI0014852A16|nr:dioxygenase [Roseomonas sp. HF4]